MSKAGVFHLRGKIGEFIFGGRFLLDDIENQLRNFVKVFPKDYKRVLTERKEREKVNVG